MGGLSEYGLFAFLRPDTTDNNGNLLCSRERNVRHLFWRGPSPTGVRPPLLWIRKLHGPKPIEQFSPRSPECVERHLSTNWDRGYLYSAFNPPGTILRSHHAWSSCIDVTGLHHHSEAKVVDHCYSGDHL